MNKKILLIFSIILLLIPSYKVQAKTLSQYKKELADLESKYNANKDKRNLTESEIKKLNSEIDSLDAQINSIKEDIVKTEKEILDSQNEIEEKRQETNELLKFLQVTSGENVYLEYIFEAESYTDFIYRYSVVSQLTDYNNNLMDELKALIEKLETKKKELAEKRSNLEAKSIELSAKLVVLRNNLAEYKQEGTSLEDDIKDLKETIKKYQDLGCYENEEVMTCVSRNSSSGVLINATGWNYPLAWGCVTSEYTTGSRTDWSGGGSHLGIDLDCVGEGTTVYAAATGVVARVVYYYHCGGNMVFIHHNVNGVPYTTVYMHLLRINVSENQIVTPSTKIGEVGGSSTRSYDGCTSGAHLHFGMAYGHNAFNFYNNTFNPRNLFNFPALVYNGGGYFHR